jgi:hypothetical protein
MISAVKKHYAPLLAAGILFSCARSFAAYDFTYYEHKTRKFLEYYGYEAPQAIEIKEIEDHKKRPGWVIKAYRLKNTIYINSQAFETESHGVNLFTCAHESAHVVFHATTAKGYDIEQDADVKAAEMLCAHGYAWVVQEKIHNLALLIEQNVGDISDEKKPRPTVKTQHEYLTKILDAYLAQHPIQARLLKMNSYLDTALLAGSHLVVGISGIVMGAKIGSLDCIRKYLGI